MRSRQRQRLRISRSRILRIATLLVALSALFVPLIVATNPVEESPGSPTSTSAQSGSGAAAADSQNVNLAQARKQAKKNRKKNEKLRRQGASSSSSSQLGLLPLPIAANMNNVPDPFVAPDRELEGQLAAYSGITSKDDVWSPNLRGSGGFNEKEKWRSNPYWRYFRCVWGSAPFIDANFRMWLSGALKGEFSKPNRVVKGQTTKALPAALRYFDSRYDPIIDTPYDSAYDLFSQATPDLTGHGEFYLKPRKLPKATPTGNVHRDCYSGKVHYPCGVPLESLRSQFPTVQAPFQALAGAPESRDWVQLDGLWSPSRNGDDGARPENMPPPPFPALGFNPPSGSAFYNVDKVQVDEVEDSGSSAGHHVAGSAAAEEAQRTARLFGAGWLRGSELDEHGDRAALAARRNSSSDAGRAAQLENGNGNGLQHGSGGDSQSEVSDHDQEVRHAREVAEQQERARIVLEREQQRQGQRSRSRWFHRRRGAAQEHAHGSGGNHGSEAEHDADEDDDDLDEEDD